MAAALTTVVAVGALFLLRDTTARSGGDVDHRLSLSQYTVRTGDTLTAVAELHGIDLDVLLEATGLTLADSLEPGSVVEIPAVPTEGHAWPPGLAGDATKAQQAVYFDRWAEEYGVPTALLESLAWQISQWDNTSINGDGDVGIGRIDPNLVGWINDELIAGDTRVDPRSPESNVQLMAAHLGHLLDQTGGDHAAAVAAYYLDRQEPTEATWDLHLRNFVTDVLVGVADFEAPAPPAATPPSTTPAD